MTIRLSRLKRSIFRIRYWHEAHQKVRSWYTSKDEILLGNEEACDLRIDALSRGEVYRIDLQRELLHKIESQDEISAPPDSLINLGSMVIEWSEIDLLPLRKVSSKWIVGCLCVLSLAMASLLFGSEGDQTILNCTRLEIRIASKNWRPLKGLEPLENKTLEQLSVHRKFFQKSLSSKSFISARLELSQMSKLLEENHARFECGATIPLTDLEAVLAEQQILVHLSQKHLVSAAEEINQFKGILSPGIYSLLSKRLIDEAKKLVQKSWLIENESPEESYALRRKVQSICNALDRETACLESPDQIPNQMMR